MKNILKNAENAEKLLELTSDTMILLDRNGICVDIAVHNADLWFLKENQLLDRNTPTATVCYLPAGLPRIQESTCVQGSFRPELRTDYRQRDLLL